MKGARHLFVISLSIASFIVAHASVEAQPIIKNTTSGPVEVRVTLDPPTPLIGDPVTLRIEVVAEGTLDTQHRFHATKVLTRCASKYAASSPSNASQGEASP